MLSVSRCDDDASRDPRYKHCFEVNTQGRGYLFCADTEEDLAQWITVFEQVIPHDAADNLVRIPLHMCQRLAYMYLVLW